MLNWVLILDVKDEIEDLWLWVVIFDGEWILGILWIDLFLWVCGVGVVWLLLLVVLVGDKGCLCVGVCGCMVEVGNSGGGMLLMVFWLLFEELVFVVLMVFLWLVGRGGIMFLVEFLMLVELFGFLRSMVLIGLVIMLVVVLFFDCSVLLKLFWWVWLMWIVDGVFILRCELECLRLCGGRDCWLFVRSNWLMVLDVNVVWMFWLVVSMGCFCVGCFFDVWVFCFLLFVLWGMMNVFFLGLCFLFGLVCSDWIVEMVSGGRMDLGFFGLIGLIIIWELMVEIDKRGVGILGVLRGFIVCDWMDVRDKVGGGMIGFLCGLIFKVCWMDDNERIGKGVLWGLIFNVVIVDKDSGGWIVLIGLIV